MLSGITVATNLAMTVTGHSAEHDWRSQPGPPLTLGQFTETRLLVPRLLSAGQVGAIRELSKRLEATGRIPDATAFSEVVGAREMSCPTFVGAGVVVPHGRGGAVRRLSLAVGLSSAGIRWGGDSRLAANVVFLFAIPLSQAATYLALLSALPSLIHDERGCAILKAARQPEQMLRLLNSVQVVRPATAVPGEQSSGP